MTHRPTSIMQNNNDYKNFNQGEPEAIRTFISYATDWDIYEGDKPWNNLSISEQNQFFKEQFSLCSETQWVQAMQSGLLRKHAEAWRFLFVLLQIRLNEAGLIFSDELTDDIEDLAYEFSQALDCTCIGKRLFEYHCNESHDVTLIEESDFTYLQNILSYDFSSDVYEFIETIRSSLKFYESYGDTPNPYVDTVKLAIQQIDAEADEIENRLSRSSYNSTSAITPNKISLLGKLRARLFPSLDKKLVIREIKEIKDFLTVKFEDITFSESIIKEAYHDAIKSLDLNCNIENYIKNQKIRHHTLALVFFFTSLKIMLSSGNFHVYRGTLSGKGHQLKQITIYSLDELEKTGHITSEKRAEITSELNAIVKNIG